MQSRPTALVIISSLAAVVEKPAAALTSPAELFSVTANILNQPLLISCEKRGNSSERYLLTGASEFPSCASQPLVLMLKLNTKYYITPPCMLIQVSYSSPPLSHTLSVLCHKAPSVLNPTCRLD